MSEPQYDYSDMPDPVEQREIEIRKLKGQVKLKDAQIAKLREALERYGAHKSGCFLRGYEELDLQCSCGLDAALKGGEGGR